MNKKVIAILDYAMRMENDAKEFYEYNVDRVSSPEIKELFLELVEMEKSHYAVLDIMKEKLHVPNPPLPISWVVDNTSREVDPSILSKNFDFVANEKSLSDLSVIRLAYLMESDFAMFYKNAAEKVEEQAAKDFLLELASWETQHKDMFQKKYETLLKHQWSEVTNIIFE